MHSPSDTTINSESKAPEREGEAVPTSIEEANPSQECHNKTEPDVYSSRASTSTHNDNAQAPLPENPKSVLTKNESDKHMDEGEDEDEGVEELDEDSEDDFPEFIGGEPRGRIVSPVAGPKPRPVRPK